MPGQAVLLLFALANMSLFLIPFWKEDYLIPEFVFFCLFSSVVQNNHALSASVNHYRSLKGFLESSSSI